MPATSPTSVAADVRRLKLPSTLDDTLPAVSKSQSLLTSAATGGGMPGTRKSQNLPTSGCGLVSCASGPLVSDFGFLTDFGFGPPPLPPP